MNKLLKVLNKKNRGFTLIELVVVIGILAILAALAIPAIAGYFKSSKAETNLSNAKIIYNACSAWAAANPAETAAPDMTTDLVGENYLTSEPKTGEGASYTIGGTATEPTVTWSAETDLASENPDGTAPSVGDSLVFP